MIQFLQLIRFPNLIMIALTQFLFFYCWIVPFDDCYIKTGLFSCVVLATVLIAAGGNIINDIYDVKTDRINKPNRVFIGSFISKKKALLLYFITTLLGIAVGSYAGFAINHGWVSIIFIAIAALLFLYSSHLKGIPVLGNIVVSILVASSLLLLIAFDKEHTVRGKHVNLFMSVSFIAINIYAIFAFLINLMREMVKDIEDINGDYNAGINTLPIVLGRNRVHKIVAVLAGLLIGFILYIISIYLVDRTITTIYTLITLLFPLLYFIIKILQADTKREYRRLSLLLKLIMLFGILSTVVYYLFEPLSKFYFLM